MHGCKLTADHYITKLQAIVNYTVMNFQYEQ